ncbi:MAG: beta-glucuronidase [Ruminococcaceae bacterium]|nr:beta-glucuronidase [Oscillospiraceae bacterium]
MGRLFDEHIKRYVASLDGTWKFRTDPEKIGEQEKWFNGIPGAINVTVPSVWAMYKDTPFYEGAAWYQKDFYTDGGCLRFCFGAVMTEADVWLDGVYLGNHYCGFTQFDFIVPEVAAGRHVLVVRVDNSFDQYSIPQNRVDWFHHGGITRSVTVETLKGVCILNNRLEYEIDDALKNVTGKFVLELYNAGGKENTTVKAMLDDVTVCELDVTVKAGDTVTVTTPEFTLENVRLWNILAPELYNISLSTDTDDLMDRVGFRKLVVADAKVFINGKEAQFRGVNRHEDHPEFGFAFPIGLMQRDIDLITDMGCNAIRGSHYPNAQEFIDLLDENGVMFWSEIPIWGCGFSAETLADPIIIERGLNMHREAVKYYYNHPCITMWGLHNEILLNTKEGHAISKVYYDFLKANGGNRAIVYACNMPMEDICFEFCDIMCPNVYYGWYTNSLDDWAPFLEKFLQRRHDLGYDHKPIIFSEFGGAALYGCHDNSDVWWSEEFQAKMLTHVLNTLYSTPGIIGSYVWEFCDSRTYYRLNINRARGYNNKGIMSEYRKPKLAYHAVGEIYRKLAENNK